jgi:hypothetical protein
MSIHESIHESIQQLHPRLFRSGKPKNEVYDKLMNLFDRLMHEELELNAENKDTLTRFINNGITNIYSQFDSDSAIHPETLNILIRAIQLYNKANETQYTFTMFENEADRNDPTVHFMNKIVLRAAQRGELFDLTRDAYTRAQLKAQLEAQRYASDEKAKKGKTNMEEVDGGAKRKRTKRRHKRKQRKQRKSKRVKKVIH